MIEWPTPPAHLAGGIGSGDFWQTGNAIVGLTMAFAGLHPHDRVLDVGCGLGRVAARSPSIPSAFAFITSLYNPSGAIRAEDFAFPWSDGAFTVAIASSIFTHLPPLATSNYLRQIARTLESGGRLFSSFFVLDDESRQLVRTRVTDPAFTTAFAEGMYADRSTAEGAVAFDAQWLADTLKSAGFIFDSFIPDAGASRPVRCTRTSSSRDGRCSARVARFSSLH
ncbi:MAG TPA: class I SAM-dependent methyltransferase [Thermoanaerobaculia bacterium]